jgi:hypothetical protein
MRIIICRLAAVLPLPAGCPRLPDTGQSNMSAVNMSAGVSRSAAAYWRHEGCANGAVMGRIRSAHWLVGR